MHRLLFLLPFTVLFCSVADGCSSFAWFGEGGPLYGMNFDWYPDLEIIFSVSYGPDGGDVFTMAYQQGDADPIQVVGMTGQGLFATMQVVDTDVGTGTLDDGEAMVWMPFVLAMWQADDLDDIEAYMDTVKLVQYSEIPLHLLVADSDGRAIVVEVGEEGNRLFPLDDGEPFMAMTNFSHAANDGLGWVDISGCGADRYRTVCSGLADRGGSLDVDGAMAVLEAALNKSEDFPTRASMAFDPTEQMVYIALEGDMQRIWSISLEERTVSGHRGLPEELLYDLPSDGMTSIDLSLRVEGASVSH